MKKDIISCFNLTGMILDRLESNENICLHVRNPRNAFLCPKCGRNTKAVYDRKKRKIIHGVFADKKVLLALKVRRFKCQPCQYVFTEPRPLGVSRKRYDDHFADEALKHLSSSGFKETERKVSGRRSVFECG